jgi:hypothetical protein
MKQTTFPFHSRLSGEDIDIFTVLDIISALNFKDSAQENFPEFKFLDNVGALEQYLSSDCADFLNRIDWDAVSWPLNNCYGGPEGMLLDIFTRFIKKDLESPEFDGVKKLMEEELNAINLDLTVNDYDIAKLFPCVQDSILQGQIPDEKLMHGLYDLVVPNNPFELSLEQKQRWQSFCLYFFKFFPKDFNSICKHCEQFLTNIKYFEAKLCYAQIGGFGMKQLTYLLITKHNSEPEIVSRLRHYSELFCLTVDLLVRLPVPTEIYTQKSSEILMLALVRCAYGLGRIDREKNFFTKGSLDFMSSLGHSHVMNERFKIKYENCEKLVKEAEELWADGDMRQHNAMADYLLKNSNNKAHVTKSLLLPKLKEVALKYGLARGVVKKQR